MSNPVYYFQQYAEISGTATPTSVDNYSTTNYDGTPRIPSGQSLTDISPGTWLKFNAAIPPGEFATCMLYASTQMSGQTVEIRVGSPTASILWSFTLSTTSVENYFTDSVSSYTHYAEEGAQELYFCFPDGFTGAINWFVLCQNPERETNEAKLTRMKWFTDARFGHMMHWGAYSVLGKGEWYMHNANIPKDEYETIACQPFNPTHYDPEYWADIIQNTGQKYLTITTKHHDGFAMFQTNIKEFAPYDVVNMADIHASVLQPLALACRERGIRFCAYYSLLDWGNVNEVAIEAEAAESEPIINPDDITRYLSELKEHLKEVIELFDPALIWFDGSWAAFMTDTVSSDLRWYLHRLSPDIIINNRIGGDPNQGDYSTPEKSIPASGQTELWETCMTLNDSWSYTTGDENWKTPAQVLSDLLDCASKGGNFLLDTGPTADGVIEDGAIDSLQPVGAWMSLWGDYVYGTRAGALDVSIQPGVYCTTKMPNLLYIIVTQWPADMTLRIDCPQNKINKLYWVDDEDNLLPVTVTDGLLTVTLPAIPIGELPTAVLAIEVEGYPEAKSYPDLALFRTATTNSVWFDDNDGSGPQLAVDGDSSTRWSAQVGIVPAWLEIDLLQEETVTRVAFNQYEQRIADFIIEAEVGGEWQTIFQGNTPALNYVGYLNSPMSMTKIRLTITSFIIPSGDTEATAPPPSLYEFSVLNANDIMLPIINPSNLARGAEVVANNIWNDNLQYAPNNIVDGNNNTRWAGDKKSNPNYDLVITLPRPLDFDIIRISEFLSQEDIDSGLTTRIAVFNIQILDNGTWIEIYQGTTISQPILLPRGTTSSGIKIVMTASITNDGPSLYEVEIFQTAQPELPLLTDEQLLEAEALLSFDYFWRNANTTPESTGFGLIADTPGSRSASIANSGFGLSALVIAAERGWITHDQAESRCYNSLFTLWHYAPQYLGFFYHWIDMDTLETGDSEVSTVDTMLALNGILTAGQYFGGDCATLAQQIFDRVEWDKAVEPNSGYFTMSWDAEGAMSSSTWSGFAEQFCMYPLAGGSTTHPPLDAKGNPDAGTMFYNLQRQVGHYKNSGDIIYPFGGTLFIYQFSPSWIDFSKVIDREKVDWWDNTVNATLANRQFCIDNNSLFPSLDENNWGMTACSGPDGYYAYGAPPSGEENTNNVHYVDGTVAPSGPLGSLPFTPTETLASIQALYTQHPKLWSNYGFIQSYNLSTALAWYSPGASGMTKGLSLLMIENYRTGLIWKTYMAHPVLQRGLPVVFDMISG